MTYVVRTVDQTVHEVTDITDSGNYVTKCENLLVKEQIEEVLLIEECAVSCKRCIEPPVAVVPKPRRVRATSGKPQWRVARNVRVESIQGVRFSHKAIVAALEWFDRGEADQFTEQALDQIHLAYRFLKEILITYKRIPDDTLLDTE